MWRVMAFWGWTDGGSVGPSYTFRIQVVPVYVAPDPNAAGVVPMMFVPDVAGVTRVHTVAYGDRVAGCVPMKVAAPAAGVVPVREEP